MEAYVKITKQVKFEAAHRLVNWYWSKCHNMHGHSYIVEATLEGKVNETNAVMDFTEIGDILKELVYQKYDHTILNESLQLPDPTAELLSQRIWQDLKPRLPELTNVRVYETATSWVDYDGKDSLIAGR
jgi:6-pyruvoyltetrahydropterin/6-carboxytetrahydropterin synthase